MGRKSLRQFGLKRAPNAYSLFCKQMSRDAVHDPPRHRLHKKVASKKMLHAKWHALSDMQKQSYGKQARDLVAEIQAKKVSFASGLECQSDEHQKSLSERAAGDEIIAGLPGAMEADGDAIAAEAVEDACASESDGKRVACGGSFVHTLQQPPSCNPCRDVITWTSQQLLCSGAFGQVFKGESKKTGLAYAVKVAGPELRKEYDVLKKHQFPFCRLHIRILLER